ncbi:MAG: hypothetical protein EAZ39_29735 [Oscillatoriales cyanobacterium]|nr:MAG: hypothetical protein EAZ39_29735 [Oscillatoriales cyanobacterium]
MIAAIEKLEATEIADIADKYRQQGYQVLVKSRDYDWQKFIQNPEIDLINRVLLSQKVKRLPKKR